MIRDVSLTRVFVNDQQAALDFYTNTLGLEKIQDESYGEGTRWITVAPAGARIRILLRRAQGEHEQALVGRSDARPVLSLGTDDIRGDYARFRQRGVRFLGEPEPAPWGTGAVLLD